MGLRMRITAVCSLGLAVVVCLLRSPDEDPVARAAEAGPPRPPVASGPAHGDSDSVPATKSVNASDSASGSPSDMGIVSEWTGPANRRLAELVPDLERPESVRLIPFRLGADREVLMEVRRFRQVAPDEGVFVGSVAGKAYSTAIFSYVGEAFAGFVTLYDERRSFQVTVTEDGVMRATELDIDASPGCAPPLQPRTS